MCGSSAAGIQPQIRQAIEQQVQRHPHLQPRQMHAEADVNAVPPTDIRLDLAEDVEPVRVGEALVLPVGRTQHRHDRTARRDLRLRRVRCPGWPPA